MNEVELKSDLGYWVLLNEPTLVRILGAKADADPIEDTSLGLLLLDYYLERKPVAKLKQMFPRYFQEIEQEDKQLACVNA